MASPTATMDGTYPNRPVRVIFERTHNHKPPYISMYEKITIVITGSLAGNTPLSSRASGTQLVLPTNQLNALTYVRYSSCISD